MVYFVDEIFWYFLATPILVTSALWPLPPAIGLRQIACQAQEAFLLPGHHQRQSIIRINTTTEGSGRVGSTIPYLR